MAALGDRSNDFDHLFERFFGSPEARWPKGGYDVPTDVFHTEDRLVIRMDLPDVNPDEFLSALDRDTRDYLKLLVSGAAKGLNGRGDEHVPQSTVQTLADRLDRALKRFSTVASLGRR